MDGGLGISRPHKMNEAFLMKMLWNMINIPYDLWCKVLYSKYGRDKDLRVSISMQHYDSPLWKTLAGIWDKLQNHVVWKLGDGMQTNFWLDKWMPSGHSPMNLSIQQTFDITLSVKDALTGAGDWDIN